MGVSSIELGDATASSDRSISIGNNSGSTYGTSVTDSSNFIAIGYSAHIGATSLGAIAIGGDVDGDSSGEEVNAAGAIGADVINHVVHSMLINVPLRIKNETDAVLAIINTNQNIAKRFQVRMNNNGGTGFLMTDTSVANRQWKMGTTSNGGYVASFIGTVG